jgi:hypothetical protein
MICTHTAENSQCHNRDDFPCPAHFTHLCAEMMQGAAVVDRDRITRALMDLGRHNWLTPAVYTWAGIFQHHMLLHRENPVNVLINQLTGVSFATPPEGPDTTPWVTRFEMICRAAIMGDGHMIADVLESMRGDDAMTGTATRSMLVSLARAAHDAIHLHKSSRPETVALLMTLGSQVYSPGSYGLLVPVVRIAEALSLQQEDHESARVVGSSAPEILTEMVGTSVRAFGQCVAAENPMSVVVNSVREGAEGKVSGILDWRNEQADTNGGPVARMYARAMRAGVAFANEDDETLVQMIVKGRDIAIDVMVGSASLVMSRIEIASEKGGEDHPHG